MTTLANVRRNSEEQTLEGSTCCRIYLCSLWCVRLATLCLTASFGSVALSQETLKTPPRKEVTYTECIQSAIRNPLAATRWRVAREQAASALSLAKTRLFPVVTSSLIGRIATNRDVLFTASDQTTFINERARIGLTLTYPLYDGGKRQAQVRAAQANLHAAEHGARDNQIQTVEETATAFYALLHQQRLEEVSRQQLKAAQEHLRDAQSRLELGTVTRADLLTAQTALEAANAMASNRQANLVSVRARLANLIGLDPTMVSPVAAEPTATPELAADATQLIAQALAYSPALARARAEREAARGQLSVIRADKSPAVSLRANPGYVFRGGNGVIGDRASGYFLFFLDVSFPLFQGPDIRARERNQTAEMELRDAALRQLELDIKEQIIASNATYRASLVSVRAGQEAMRNAEESHRLADERYKVGKGTQIEVFDALARLAAARDSLLLSLYNRDVAAQQLRWSTGLETLPQNPFSMPGTR